MHCANFPALANILHVIVFLRKDLFFFYWLMKIKGNLTKSSITPHDTYFLDLTVIQNIIFS